MHVYITNLNNRIAKNGVIFLNLKRKYKSYKSKRNDNIQNGLYYNIKKKIVVK